MKQNAIILPRDIDQAQERQVQTLLADQWRKLVLIQLRRGVLLADHSARMPITVHAIVGRGILRVDDNEYALTPGVIVPVDAHVVHSVQADPDLAILVTFFRQPIKAGESDTTARFD